MLPVSRRELLSRAGALASLPVLNRLIGDAAATSEDTKTDDAAVAAENGRGPDGQFEASWSSLGQHEVPEWYDDAKLGLFLHWGVYSVPGWATVPPDPGDEKVPVAGYAEWYPFFMHIEGSYSNLHHRRVYGDPYSTYEYKDFMEPEANQNAPPKRENVVAFETFDAAGWDPDRWADLFDDIGARYVIPTAEHHDGFPMWDSEHTDWNAANMGPERDLIKELADAVRDRGMRFAGSYHAQFNYYDPRHKGLFGNPDWPPRSPDNEYSQYWRDKLYELFEHVEPDVLWLDNGVAAEADNWKMKQVISDFYNKAEEEWDKEVVVNDRVGLDSDFYEYGDFATPEYDAFDRIVAKKWEATRGLGASFGYNRQSRPDDYLTITELVHNFVDVVSKNGNLLLNFGPKANGVIPEIQRRIVTGFGEWMDTNGEALYGTRPWVDSEHVDDGTEVRYTRKDRHIYAIMYEWPGESVTLDVTDHVDMNPDYEVQMLGIRDVDGYETLDWEVTEEGLEVQMPDIRPSGDNEEHAYSLKIEAVDEPSDLKEIVADNHPWLNPNIAELPYTADPVSVDTVADDAWADAPTYAIDNVVHGTQDGPDGLSAEFRGLYDEESLYLLVDVTDSTYEPVADPAAPARGDGVELYFDIHSTYGVVAPENHYVITRDGAFFDVSSNNERNEEERPPENAAVTVATTETESGYVVEAEIPWSLFEDFDGRPETTNRFRMDIAVNDGTGAGGGGSSERSDSDFSDAGSASLAGPDVPEEALAASPLDEDHLARAEQSTAAVTGDSETKLAWNNDGRTDNAMTRDSYGDFVLIRKGGQRQRLPEESQAG